MWTLIWTVVSAGIILLLLMIAVKFGGKGHLDVKRSTEHYLGEVEARSRFPWA